MKILMKRWKSLVQFDDGRFDEDFITFKQLSFVANFGPSY